MIVVVISVECGIFSARIKKLKVNNKRIINVEY